MKKLFVVSLLVVNLPAFGLITNNVPDGCGTVGTSPRALFTRDNYTCTSGNFLPANGVACASCPSDATCDGGWFEFDDTSAQGIVMPDVITQNMNNVCSVDLTNADSNNNSNIRAVFVGDVFNCNPGYYLPADSLGCVICPSDHYCSGGTYMYNETITQGINDCPSTYLAVAGSSSVSDCRADLYQCTSGTYLPMNTRQCETCPTGAVCPGGTYDYNATVTQGMFLAIPITQSVNDACYTNVTNATNGNSNIRAIFYPNTYTCSAGQYLPANGIECATCPADSYCLGGTYTFNATTAQGATACDAGAHSPAGSSSAAQCVAGYTCTSGQYLPKNTTVCASCPNGYTCGGGTYSFDENLDQGIIANTITITWNGALQSDIEANEAGTCTYGGDIRTPVRADPAQIPTGKRFVGWVFRKTNN